MAIENDETLGWAEFGDDSTEVTTMTRERCAKLTDHLERSELVSLALFLTDELGYGLYDLDKGEHIAFMYNQDGEYQVLDDGE